MCACAGISSLSQPVCAETAEQNNKKPSDGEEHPAVKELRWKQNWVKRVFTRLLETMDKTLDEPTRQKILISMGRECANVWGFPAKYKGNFEEFWNKEIERWKEAAEIAEYDREKGVIMISSAERTDCTCVFVDKEKTPRYFCDCSLGWQMELFETILRKPVKVELVDSVLRGGKRCVFKIRILS